MTRESKVVEQVCEPHCIKEADLGRLDARIENNEKTGVEIKEALQRLNENHERDKQFSNQQFTTITAEIAKISTAMQQSVESNKELLENQYGKEVPEVVAYKLYDFVNEDLEDSHIYKSLRGILEKVFMVIQRY